jgi:uncharacterized protein (DUF934 family)
MSNRIIRDGTIVADDWTLVPTDASELSVASKLIVPLKLWQAHRKALIARGEPLGIWLDSANDPANIAADVNLFSVIALNFPTFKDGRNSSTAYLLRTRYAYKGELRAIGDVLRDQLFAYKRVGFNAFAVRADRDIDDALKGLNDFSDVYQGSVDQPLPLYRRRSVTPPKVTKASI